LLEFKIQLLQSVLQALHEQCCKLHSPLTGKLLAAGSTEALTHQL
jgi:hypothetical protein